MPPKYDLLSRLSPICCLCGEARDSSSLSTALSNVSETTRKKNSRTFSPGKTKRSSEFHQMLTKMKFKPYMLSTIMCIFLYIHTSIIYPKQICVTKITHIFLNFAFLSHFIKQKCPILLENLHVKVASLLCCV